MDEREFNEKLQDWGSKIELSALGQKVRPLDKRIAALENAFIHAEREWKERQETIEKAQEEADHGWSMAYEELSSAEEALASLSGLKKLMQGKAAAEAVARCKAQLDGWEHRIHEAKAAAEQAQASYDSQKEALRAQLSGLEQERIMVERRQQQEKAKTNALLRRLAALADDFIPKGPVIRFGRYEQDNGVEPIEWIVLSADEATGRYLLISRYALDAWHFACKEEYPTWAKCHLRAWLNGEFLNAAFTAGEQDCIAAVTVSTPSCGGIDGGPDTVDKLWLLSSEEADTVFRSDEARMTAPTAYALKQGADDEHGDYCHGRKTCEWWLRSPGFSALGGAYADSVRSSGFISSNDVTCGGVAVRPAFWLDPDRYENYRSNPPAEEAKCAAEPAPASPFRTVGSIIRYGRYEQEPGQEAPIEWIVLDYDPRQEHALLLSKYCLDAAEFDPMEDDPEEDDPEVKIITWDRSGIRAWLNSDFLNRAFTEEEQASIVSADVSTQWCGVNSGGEDTVDKVWLLSREEAERYFRKDFLRRALPTAYAVDQGVYQENPSWSNRAAFSRELINGEGCCRWWLRSPGRETNNIVYVDRDGSLTEGDVSDSNPVRPALWLDLNTADID